MERLIFMIPKHICKYNAFELSELNELDELPEEIKTLMRLCKRTDKVYNIDNFALDFNLSDKLTKSNNYIMFIPALKFDLSFLALIKINEQYPIKRAQQKQK